MTRPPATDGGADENRDAAATATAGGRPADASSLFPTATVDSRWWYWIAAVPVYFVVTLVVGALFFAVFFLGLFFDPRAVVPGVFLFVLGTFVLALPGLVLTVTFPLALYVDAQAVAAADVDWRPDPALYGLVGLAGVLVTAFTVSVPLALYYLYRRHRAVGVP